MCHRRASQPRQLSPFQQTYRARRGELGGGLLLRPDHPRAYKGSSDPQGSALPFFFLTFATTTVGCKEYGTEETKLRADVEFAP